METVKRIFRIVLDTPKKKAYMDEIGCYRAIAGNWCDSHGFILYSAKEYRNVNYPQLKLWACKK